MFKCNYNKCCSSSSKVWGQPQLNDDDNWYDKSLLYTRSSQDRFKWGITIKKNK